VRYLRSHSTTIEQVFEQVKPITTGTLEPRLIFVPPAPATKSPATERRGIWPMIRPDADEPESRTACVALRAVKKSELYLSPSIP
jgi:hypothetical protein